MSEQEPYSVAPAPDYAAPVAPRATNPLGGDIPAEYQAAPVGGYPGGQVDPATPSQPTDGAAGPYAQPPVGSVDYPAPTSYPPVQGAYPPPGPYPQPVPYPVAPGYPQTGAGYPQPGYPAPGYSPGAYTMYIGGTQKNSLGVAALVSGILSITMCPWIASIVAIITGAMGMGAAGRGEANNRSTAVAGLVLGIASIVGWTFFWGLLRF